MLCLLLFNSGGYTLLFQYLIYRSDTSVIQCINTNSYKSCDLVAVHIPVHLNIADWNDYAVISGQVKYKEHIYDYAELKLTRDTMYLLCLPNHNKARLAKMNITYAKQITGIPQNRKSGTPDVTKVFGTNDYLYPSSIANKNFHSDKKQPITDSTRLAIVKTPSDIPGQPPEVYSFNS